MPQVTETSISSTVDVLLSPEAPLALRLSGQLLLGVCRIYARKVSYLLQVGTCGTRTVAGQDFHQARPLLYCWLANCCNRHICMAQASAATGEHVAHYPYALRWFGAFLHLQDCQDALVKIRLAFRCVTTAGWVHTLGLRRHAHTVSHTLD